MRLWTNNVLVAALAIFFGPMARAEMTVPPPVKVTWNGFIHHWATVGENNMKEYVNAGTLLKRLRFKMGVEAYDGVSVVIVPELAGGAFTLLDGYAAVDLSKYNVDFIPPLTITAGQFKTPFGLNRMYLPNQLALVDYSPSSVMQTTSFWDNGVMFSHKPLPWIKADAAWVEGLGANQASPGGNGFGLKANQDFVGRLEMMPPMVTGLTVGGSVYYGEAFTTPGTVGFPSNPKLITGAHLKYALFGKSFAIEGEFINRDLDRGAYNLQVTQYIIDELQLAIGYDHMMDYRNDKADATRYIGGINYFPGGPVRLSLQQMGTATGPSQQPVDSRTVLQTQVTW